MNSLKTWRAVGLYFGGSWRWTGSFASLPPYPQCLGGWASQLVRSLCREHAPAVHRAALREPNALRPGDEKLTPLLYVCRCSERVVLTSIPPGAFMASRLFKLWTLTAGVVWLCLVCVRWAFQPKYCYSMSVDTHYQPYTALTNLCFANPVTAADWRHAGRCWARIPYIALEWKNATLLSGMPQLVTIP
jgi:hypothetical protein